MPLRITPLDGYALQPEDRATARAQLEDASANNILLEIMQDRGA